MSSTLITKPVWQLQNSSYLMKCEVFIFSNLLFFAVFKNTWHTSVLFDFLESTELWTGAWAAGWVLTFCGFGASSAETSACCCRRSSWTSASVAAEKIERGTTWRKSSRKSRKLAFKYFDLNKIHLRWNSKCTIKSRIHSLNCELNYCDLWLYLSSCQNSYSPSTWNMQSFKPSWWWFFWGFSDAAPTCKELRFETNCRFDCMQIPNVVGHISRVETPFDHFGRTEEGKIWQAKWLAASLFGQEWDLTRCGWKTYRKSLPKSTWNYDLECW